MGHQSNEARKALRAYARDLQATAVRSAASLAGEPKQGDAPIQYSGSGAPHQLAIAAAVVCVVLLGGIGFASAVSSTPQAESQQANPMSAQSASASAVLARAGGASTAQAIRAFNDLGMSRSASALSTAEGTGTYSSTAVQEALADLVVVVTASLATSGEVFEADIDVALAVGLLEKAVLPPGLDPENLPPGLGGTAPPDQNPLWTPPGQDDDFTPPGQDDDFTPPGQDDDFTPPGQDKEKPEQDGGRP